LVVQRSEGDTILPKNKQGFADFAQFSDTTDAAEGTELEQPRKHGAFEVYRKPLSNGFKYFKRQKKIKKYFQSKTNRRKKLKKHNLNQQNYLGNLFSPFVLFISI